MAESIPNQTPTSAKKSRAGSMSYQSGRNAGDNHVQDRLPVIEGIAQIAARDVAQIDPELNIERLIEAEGFLDFFHERGRRRKLSYEGLDRVARGEM